VVHKAVFLNCFECVKLKDICKFQYCRSTAILFEYLCRFSSIFLIATDTEYVINSNTSDSMS
jgi:hypothetical protein